MEKLINRGIIIFLVALLSPQIVQAQGTPYVSSLGYSSTGSNPVGSDSWLASGFKTGTNAGGYALDSVQLGMMDASGNPSGFSVMIYSSEQHQPYSPDYFPRSSLGSLSGSASPATAGTYTYAAPSSLALSPSTVYFIVLTAGTAQANGDYNWSNMNATQIPYYQSDGWRAPMTVQGIDDFYSIDGSPWSGSSWGSWFYSANFHQFAINATAVPEPSAPGLLSLGGLILGWRWRKSACA